MKFPKLKTSILFQEQDTNASSSYYESEEPFGNYIVKREFSVNLLKQRICEGCKYEAPLAEYMRRDVNMFDGENYFTIHLSACPNCNRTQVFPNEL